MSCALSVAGRVSESDPVLWTVKSYLDLITKGDRLVAGSGLKRLYALSMGLATYNHNDIVDATAKAVSMGLIPSGLNGFMEKSIIKNCHIYAQVLHDIISNRIIGISNGDVQAPRATIRDNLTRARRPYYTVPMPFIDRLSKTLSNRWAAGTAHENPMTLTSMAAQADFLLMNMQGNEGHISPQQTSMVGVVTCVERLVAALQYMADYDDKPVNYREEAVPALKILWVIAKILMGDLTIEPQPGAINFVGLSSINMTDGTLAAIPFPIRQSLDVFRDDEINTGISMKACTYLSAVSSATSYRREYYEG